MKHLVNKLLLALACAALLGAQAPGLPNTEPGLAVAALLVAATVSALFELARPTWRAALPAAMAAAACAAPGLLLPALPLASYDLARIALDGRKNPAWGWAVVAAAPLLPAMGAAMEHFGAGSSALIEAAALVAPAASLGALAWLLGMRTARSLAIQRELEGLRDTLQESVLRLRRQNAELDEARAYQARAATLAERARIARAIHDNVGHLLTRAVFQVEALRVVHDADGLAPELAPMEKTLHEALDTVRASVHDLHDESVDLEAQLAAIAASYAGGTAELRYAVEHRPSPAATDCLAAVVRESLANAARHGRADRVRVELEEHPGFWRLRVSDNGRGSACGPPSPDGLGLRSMRERVEALGGTFWARSDPHGTPGGFTVFASIPKHPRSSP